jgi:hypothetical protein
VIVYVRVCSLQHTGGRNNYLRADLRVALVYNISKSWEGWWWIEFTGKLLYTNSKNYPHYRSMGPRWFWEVKASRFHDMGT